MSKSAFRSLVALGILLGVIALIASIIGERYLPDELKIVVERTYAEPPSIADLAIVVLGFCGIISYFGLLFFARWAKILFPIFYLFHSATYAFTKPFVYTGLETAFSSLSLLVSGLIIGVIYFSDVKNHFKVNKGKKSAGSSIKGVVKRKNTSPPTN